MPPSTASRDARAGYRAVTPDRHSQSRRRRGVSGQGPEGWGFQDDLTFTSFDGTAGHTVKTGFKYKQIEINAFEQQPFNPQFLYDVTQDPTIPFVVQFGAALPGLPSATCNRRIVGIYIQDDWEVTEAAAQPRLALRLRGDAELPTS